MRIFVRIFDENICENIWWEYLMRIFDENIRWITTSACSSCPAVRIFITSIFTPTITRTCIALFRNQSSVQVIMLQYLCNNICFVGTVCFDIWIWVFEKNIARIANAVHCHTWLSGNKDCHEFRFSIVRIVISVSIATSLQDCLVSQNLLWRLKLAKIERLLLYVLKILIEHLNIFCFDLYVIVQHNICYMRFWIIS